MFVDNLTDEQAQLYKYVVVVFGYNDGPAEDRASYTVARQSNLFD